MKKTARQSYLPLTFKAYGPDGISNGILQSFVFSGKENSRHIFWKEHYITSFLVEEMNSLLI